MANLYSLTDIPQVLDEFLCLSIWFLMTCHTVYDIIIINITTIIVVDCPYFTKDTRSVTRLVN